LGEAIEKVDGERTQEVLSTLERAEEIVFVRVLWQGRESEETLEKIGPLWRYCPAFAAYATCRRENDRTE
jgi:hypothetical protein